MQTLIVLIRGINVGGHKKLRMAELQEICESVGLVDVRTYLQSGNLVCRSKHAPATVAKRVADALHKSAAMDVGVMARTPADLQRVIENNPFEERARAEPGRVMVAFLDREPTRDALAALLARHTGPERLELHGVELYIDYRAGAGNSKLTGSLIERTLGVAATMRNWNTVTALAALAGPR